MTDPGGPHRIPWVSLLVSSGWPLAIPALFYWNLWRDTRAATSTLPANVRLALDQTTLRVSIVSIAATIVLSVITCCALIYRRGARPERALSDRVRTDLVLLALFLLSPWLVTVLITGSTSHNVVDLWVSSGALERWLPVVCAALAGTSFWLATSKRDRELKLSQGA